MQKKLGFMDATEPLEFPVEKAAVEQAIQSDPQPSGVEQSEGQASDHAPAARDRMVACGTGPCRCGVASTLPDTAGRPVADRARLLNRCLKRVGSWRVPPNWSAADWLYEMQALAEAAAFHAECEFDSLRGVPMEAFIYQRIVARAFTRYRQEWTYAVRCLPEEWAATSGSDEDEDRELPGPANSYDCPGQAEECEWVGDRLQAALEYLPGSDRSLLLLLFWEGHTESEIASNLGISQPAVNKRKRAVLHLLKDCLRAGRHVRRLLPKQQNRRAVIKSQGACI